MTNNDELISELRDYASNSGYSHNDYADVMRLAADALAAQSAQPADKPQGSGAQVRDIKTLHEIALADYAVSDSDYNEGFADGIDAALQVLMQSTAPSEDARDTIQQQIVNPMVDVAYAREVRRLALEEAAKVCEGCRPIMAGTYFRGQREQSDKCAAAIRSLSEAAPGREGS